VPELPEPAPAQMPEFRPRGAGAGADRRAAGYAEAVLRSAAEAPEGDRHPALRKAAITLFGMAEHGLLEDGAVWRDLLAVAASHRWPERRAHQLLEWSAAFARAKRPLPEAFA